MPLPVFTNNENQCRTCGGPMFANDADSIHCSRCWLRLLGYSGPENLPAIVRDIARRAEGYMPTDEDERQMLDEISRLPVELLQVFASMGWKLVLHNEEFFTETRKKDLEKTLLLLEQKITAAEALAAITHREMPDDLKEKIAQFRNGDLTVFPETKRFALEPDEKGEKPHFMTVRSEDRVVYVQAGSKRAFFAYAVLIGMAHQLRDAESEQIRSWKALYRVQDIRASFLPDGEIREHEQTPEVIISPRSTHGWAEYFADCVLVMSGLEEDCTPERLAQLSPESVTLYHRAIISAREVLKHKFEEEQKPRAAV